METPTKQNSIKKNIIEWLQIIGIAILLAIILNKFIIANSDVPTPSMEPTITSPSRILGSRLTYRFSDIERGDVVIFVFGWRCPKCKEIIEGEKQGNCSYCGTPSTKNAETINYVKRVIGIPGDVIDITDDSIYLNNSEEPLEEPYLPDEEITYDPCHFEVPEGRYFMMGDNRNYSADARYWENPYILEEKIIAKVYLEYFPKIKKIR